MQEQNEKLNFYLHIKASGLGNNYKVANGIYISQAPVSKFSLQDFVVIRPFFCAVKHGMRDGMCKDCTALVKCAQLVDTECVVELGPTYKVLLLLIKYKAD